MPNCVAESCYKTNTMRATRAQTAQSLRIVRTWLITLTQFLHVHTESFMNCFPHAFIIIKLSVGKLTTTLLKLVSSLVS